MPREIQIRLPPPMNFTVAKCHASGECLLVRNRDGYPCFTDYWCRDATVFHAIGLGLPGHMVTPVHLAYVGQ